MVVCGNSEVAQQSAMMRVSPASLGHTLFRERLAAVAAQTLPDVPYWPSTPWGGALPFQVNSGTAHYFGVGAYLRDLYDARRSQVRFTTECLGFANVPEPESLALAGISAHSAGSAEWKARSPRDGGATWDFEDVRDHYVARFFGDEPLAQRVSSPEEYLAHGRAATAMAVERTMQEFRRVGSSCHGAMIWMWTDPWLGAGWGCVDSTGRPKSVWFGLRRASRSVAIALTNEGLNGACVHAWNDSSVDVHGTLTLRLLRDGSVETARATVPLSVPARSAAVHNGDAVLGNFTDIVHAYQFGPVAHDVVHALWLQHDQPGGNAALDADAFGASTIIAESVLFPHGDVRGRVSTGLRVDAIKRIDERHAWLSVTCDRVTPHVRVGAAEWIPDDSYFTLVPGVRHVVRLTRCGTASSAFDPDQDCTVSDELHAVQHRDRVITIESIAALEVVHVELPPHVAIDTRVISTPSKGHA
jgi:beta-mannosidase